MNKDWQEIVRSMDEVLYDYWAVCLEVCESIYGLLPEITLIGGVASVWWYFQ